ncbi:S-layer homology domain-containing protein [Agathobaculum sp.]|uniref:S-layer homology domain-containing protein n=1 Tax=Agathobaculum sp. TaxID=2048138 RepID=UPI003AEF681B
MKFHPRFSGNRDSGANLKKVLALVLAFACAFTMFAGAAFTDSADIKVDADVVDTLVSLGIVEGFEDGSFQPNGTVTRAQMAKMIYVLRTGKSDASAYNDDKTSFTDIGSHWARGYIKYCQSLGIIAGKSNTIFAPNATVTAQEAAKMLLVTLGYNANKAGLVGANWAAKTNALADENGLLEDVNTSFTGPCPRQYAAQLIYNAIDTPTVVWRDDAYTNTNYSDGDNKTIGEKYMGLHSVEGILTSFSKEDGKSTYGATVSSITKQDGSKKVTLQSEDFTKIAKDYGSLKNNKVKVLYKDTDEVYGVFALTDSNRVLNALLGEFGTSSDKLKLDGTKYTIADAETVKLDGKTVYVAANANVGFTTNEADAKGYNANASKSDPETAGIVNYVKAAKGLTKAFDASAISNSDNNKINLLDVKSFAIAQVTYVGKDYINVSYKNSSNTQGFESKLKDDDAVWYNGIAKDDYVAVTAKVNSSEDKIAVTKLDVVTGKITATKNAITDDDYKITVDGKTYEMANVDAKDLELNATVSIVVKGDYCLLVDDADAGSKDLALMTELYPEGNRWKATLLKADGSEETVTLKKSEAINGKDVVAAGYNKFDGSVKDNGDKCKLVTYTKSGSEYKLKVVGDQFLKDSDGKPVAYKAGYDVVTERVANNYVENNKLHGGDVSAINENAIVFVRYKNDSFKVVTGKDLRDWKESSVFASVVLADKSNGVPYAKVVYADLGDKNVKGGTDVNYGYVFEATKSTDVDETNYNVFQIWNGSETIEVWTEDGKDVARGDVIKYSLDGTVENHTKISIDKKYAKSAGAKGVVLNGDYSDKLDGTAYFAPASGAAKVAKATAEAAAQPITFDDDDDSIILFANTSDDDKDGTGVASTFVTNLKDFVREDGDNYVTNAIYWAEKDAQGNPTTTIMVIDTDSELDAGVFGLTK